MTEIASPSVSAAAPSVRAGKRRLYPAWTPYLFLTPFFLIFIPFGAATVLGAVAIGFVYWEIGGDIPARVIPNHRPPAMTTLTAGPATAMANSSPGWSDIRSSRATPPIG